MIIIRSFAHHTAYTNGSRWFNHLTIIPQPTREKDRFPSALVPLERWTTRLLVMRPRIWNRPEDFPVVQAVILDHPWVGGRDIDFIEARQKVFSFSQNLDDDSCVLITNALRFPGIKPHASKASIAASPPAESEQQFSRTRRRFDLAKARNFRRGNRGRSRRSQQIDD